MRCGDYQGEVGYRAKKLNSHGELELVMNRAEPENQAGLVPSTDQKKFQFFSKNLICHYAFSARERRACCINICPRKGVSHF